MPKPSTSAAINFSVPGISIAISKGCSCPFDEMARGLVAEKSPQRPGNAVRVTVFGNIANLTEKDHRQAVIDQMHLCADATVAASSLTWG